jgi:hypothetical protein
MILKLYHNFYLMVNYNEMKRAFEWFNAKLNENELLEQRTIRKYA